MHLRDASQYAADKLREHNLSQLGWTFQFDNSKRRFGVCKYFQKVISISKSLTHLNNEATVYDVILHEIAHALAGSKAHHGAAWKAMCIKIGAKPIRCYSMNEVTTPQANYTAQCEDCHTVYKRHRKPNNRIFWCRCQRGKTPKKYLAYKNKFGQVQK